MVQSDVPRSTTKSGKVNARWYLQRLRASAANRRHCFNNYIDNDIDLNKKNAHDTVRVVRGSTAKQGQHVPRILLKTPEQPFESEPTKQKSADKHRSGSVYTTSAVSLKSASTTVKISRSRNEIISNSNQSAKIITTKYEKDTLSDRRSSIGTFSARDDVIVRPPSTPVDPRCHRAYSSTTNPIDRETCALLGPQLCSDCIEIQTRANLSSERLPANLVHQRLSALAIRRFVKNQENLTDDELLRMINNQQIQISKKTCNETNSSVMSDDEYFDRLSSSLQHNVNETPYYFKDFKDFSQKYRSNKYKRLLLSETPAPTSANPIFKESSFEKFDVSPKYSYMKRASTAKPNLKSNKSIFVSPKNGEEFYKEHRYLIDYSPPLLLQTYQQTARNHSNSQFLVSYNKNVSSLNQNRIPKRSLIASKSHQ